MSNYRLKQGQWDMSYSPEYLANLLRTWVPVSYKLFKWSKPVKTEYFRAVLIYDDKLMETYAKGFSIWRQDDIESLKQRVWWKFKKRPYSVKFLESNPNPNAVWYINTPTQKFRHPIKWLKGKRLIRKLKRYQDETIR